MLKKILARMFLVLGPPITYAIRYVLLPFNRDIKMALQRRATELAADYVERHMRGADSVYSKLELLTMVMERVDLKNTKLICEFGVHRGNTINHIASLTNQTVYGFDSFEGLPERWRDGYKKWYLKLAALPRVRANVVLIKGWFDKTIPEFIKDHNQDIGFLHIDCDLYSSTKTIFELLGHQIKPGCIIVFDEYFNYPGWQDDEYRAFHEFLERTKLTYEYIGYNSLGEQVAVMIRDHQ